MAGTTLRDVAAVTAPTASCLPCPWPDAEDVITAPQILILRLSLPNAGITEREVAAVGPHPYLPRLPCQNCHKCYARPTQSPGFPFRMTGITEREVAAVMAAVDPHSHGHVDYRRFVSALVERHSGGLANSVGQQVLLLLVLLRASPCQRAGGAALG